MAYTTYTPQMLATFTGRPVESFPEPYTSTSAIPQATLLFKMGTCIVDPSALSPEELQLIDFAILSMADAIHLSSPYQEAMASPFSSESIGSYSYSKAAGAVQSGDTTGVMWFDMAIERLSVCDTSDGLAMTGGVEIFEYQGYFAKGHRGRNVQYLTPADVVASRTFGFDLASGMAIGIPMLPGGGGDGEEEWIEDPNFPGLYYPE